MYSVEKLLKPPLPPYENSKRSSTLTITPTRNSVVEPIPGGLKDAARLVLNSIQPFM